MSPATYFVAPSKEVHVPLFAISHSHHEEDKEKTMRLVATRGMNGARSALLVALSLFICACSGKPSEGEIKQQIEAQILKEGGGIFTVTDFEKVNGRLKGDNEYIADIKYQLVPAFSLPKIGFDRTKKIPVEDEAIFQKTDNGWMLPKNYRSKEGRSINAISADLLAYQEVLEKLLTAPAPDCNPDINVDAELARELDPNRPKDSIDELFADKPVDKEATRASIERSKQKCQEAHAQYQSNKADYEAIQKYMKNKEGAGQ